MICTVHNIKKIADFVQRKGKSLKEILKMVNVSGRQDSIERGITARMSWPVKNSLFWPVKNSPFGR